MKVAVLQSNYIPWKGYFDIIHDVDRFIFYDDLQYTKNDWRNRNRIRTPEGTAWLTLPVGSDESRLVEEVRLPEHPSVMRKQIAAFRANYVRAPYFSMVMPFIADS